MFIRPEASADYHQVYQIHQYGFETKAEAKLVDALRTKAHPIVSLVAEDDVEDTLFGHILFSPVQLTGCPTPLLMGLAPLAVRADQRQRGIGSALVNEGILHCLDLGAKAIVVLGRPQYYRRFGFNFASDYQINSEFNVAAEAFMVKELEAGFLQGKSGTIKYHDEFNQLGT